MDCARSTRQIPTSSRSAFKRFGTDAAQMTMAAGSVVKHLDVIEYIVSARQTHLVTGCDIEEHGVHFNKVDTCTLQSFNCPA